MKSGQANGLQGFALRVLIVFLLVALAAFLWQALHVLLLLFGAILVAVILRGLADALAARTGLRPGGALAIVVACLAGVIGIGISQLGSQIAAQFEQLVARLPQVLEQLRGAAQDLGAGHLIPRLDDATFGNVLRHLGGVALSTFGFVADLVLVLVAGVYLAAQSELYERGLLLLLPPTQRARVRDVLVSAGAALRKWLLAQLFCMVVVGVMVGVGLTLLGVESALALGLLAGFLEFIPFLGPIAAALPAVLLAFAQDVNLALYVVAFYVAVQSLENYLLYPLVQKEAVNLPPALVLFAIAAFGAMFGLLGAIYAAPLTVIALVAVQRLYQEDVLGESPPARRRALRGIGGPGRVP